MIWTYRGTTIPLAVYHGVPKGWYARDVIAEHERLGGTHSLRGPEATEPGAPSWMPERYEWLQYRQTLYRVADGVLAGDAACVDLALRFIELRYIGSYSGFVRSLLSRRLKHASLTEHQCRRLHVHFSSLVLNGERTQEFRDYLRLWRRIISEEETQRLVEELREQPDGEMRVCWVLSTLRASYVVQPSSS